MTIHYKSAPAEGLTIAQSAEVKPRPRRARVGTDALRAAPEAHRVFTATLQDVIERRVLAAAKPASWRYFVEGGAADIVERDGKLAFASMNTALADAASDALAVAEAQEGDFELRTLTVPALNTVALWLHSEGRDLIIPLAPAPSTLKANRAYDEEKFIEALFPLATKRATIRGDQG